MNSSDDKPQRLETVILFVSFLGIWAYFFARQRTLSLGSSLPVWANVPLLLLFVALVWVFVRRLRRVGRAMKEGGVGARKR